MYSINFSTSKRRFCLSLHYGANSYLFVNDVETIKFKAKNFEIVATPLCLENISKHFSISNIKKKKKDYMEQFMILLLIMMLFQLKIC